MASMQQAWEGGGEVRQGDEKLIAACFFFALAAMLAAAFYKGGEEGRTLQAEAVKRGFATWVSDENGNTTFTWKEPTP